jgi:glycosyltransferase involved in cell wall biosynthesis
VPHIWHVHEIFGGWEGRVFPALLDALSDRVVVISETATRSLLSYRPGLEGKVVTIKNGIDLEPFKKVEHEVIERLRRELGIGWDEAVVGMVGRIGLRKGEGNFVEMARRVGKQREDVKFVIVGGTFDRRDHLLDELRGRIREAGLKGRVIVTGLRQEMAALMNLFDVLVHLPDRPESFGLVAGEAMAAGKPVVTWEAGALPEVVANGETGWVVPFGDIEGASARTIELLADAIERAYLGEMGSRKVDREFAAARYASQFTSLYREIVERV